jgi:uncharacterized protein YggE
MKSIWWTVALLVLAGISVLANKVLANDQPQTQGAGIAISGNAGEIHLPDVAPKNLR